MTVMMIVMMLVAMVGLMIPMIMMVTMWIKHDDHDVTMRIMIEMTMLMMAVIVTLMLKVTHNDINNNRIQRRNSRSFTISSLRSELSPTRTLKWPVRNRVQITHRALITCKVPRYVSRGTKGQLSY